MTASAPRLPFGKLRPTKLTQLPYMPSLLKKADNPFYVDQVHSGGGAVD
jgi:hypothetical protein